MKIGEAGGRRKTANGNPKTRVPKTRIRGTRRAEARHYIKKNQAKTRVPKIGTLGTRPQNAATRTMNQKMNIGSVSSASIAGLRKLILSDAASANSPTSQIVARIATILKTVKAACAM